MAQPPKYDYRIAATYNVALASLTNVENIRATNDKLFIAPNGYDGYNPGEFAIRGDGTDYIAGYATDKWFFQYMTRAQYSYWQTTFCGGAFSGKVTIYTRIGSTTYARYNAICHLPPPATLRQRNGTWREINVTFTHMVAL